MAKKVAIKDTRVYPCKVRLNASNPMHTNKLIVRGLELSTNKWTVINNSEMMGKLKEVITFVIIEDNPEQKNVVVEKVEEKEEK